MMQTFQIPANAMYYDDEAEIRDRYWKPRHGDWVVDVGARYGSYTLPALAAGAHVMAVDYNEQMLSILRGAAALNRFDQLETWCVMLFDGTEYPAELSAQIDEECPPRFARFATLDEIVSCHVDWIKLDVEGAELAVLKGGMRVLRESKPTLLIEDHTRVYDWVRDNRVAEEMHDLLRGLGYTVRSVPYAADTGSPRDFTIATI